MNEREEEEFEKLNKLMQEGGWQEFDEQILRPKRLMAINMVEDAFKRMGLGYVSMPPEVGDDSYRRYEIYSSMPNVEFKIIISINNSYINVVVPNLFHVRSDNKEKFYSFALLENSRSFGKFSLFEINDETDLMYSAKLPLGI